MSVADPTLTLTDGAKELQYSNAHFSRLTLYEHSASSDHDQRSYPKTALESRRGLFEVTMKANDKESGAWPPGRMRVVGDVRVHACHSNQVVQEGLQMGVG